MATIKMLTSPQSKGRHQLKKGHILSLQTNNVSQCYPAFIKTWQVACFA